MRPLSLPLIIVVHHQVNVFPDRYVVLPFKVFYYGIFFKNILFSLRGVRARKIKSAAYANLNRVFASKLKIIQRRFEKKKKKLIKRSTKKTRYTSILLP